ncbi:MAG: acyl-CoA dehydrogenase family protein [Myxococcales bacterium]|nr:acyl-CoA dehydrogenase family protein [Myxococcales bacterium]
MARWLGRTYLRPLGLECDAAGAPLSPDHPFFRQALELGLGGKGLAAVADAPEERGAQNGRPSRAARRTVVLAEEAAYWDRGMATTLPGPGLAGAPLRLLGTAEQQQRYLSIFEEAKEPRWAAFAMSEPGAGSDVARIRTNARRVPGGWVLNGEKMFISNGARASWVVVWATVDPALGRDGHRAFVVERGTSGFSVARVEKKMGLAAAELASLVLDDVRIPDEALLGGEERYRERGGFKAAMRTFDVTRPLVGAMAVGLGQAAFDQAMALAKEAGLAGSRDASAARLRDRLARARRLVEHARLLCWRAAYLADLRQPNSVEASMAKAYAPRAALEAASLGIEVLGAAGARSDRLLEKLYRDVKVLDIVEGTGEIQRLAMARKLLGLKDDGAQA